MAYALIWLGWFLEVWYYAYRFLGDGIQLWLAVIIGVTLTLMLSVAVIMRKRVLVVALAVYSILATSAGQALSLAVITRQQEQQRLEQQVAEQHIAELKRTVDTINKQIDNIQAGIAETAQTLKERAIWRTALQQAEEQISELRQKRDEYLQKIAEKEQIIIKNVQKQDNIYIFYHNLTGIKTEILQFVLQTILSLFIALAAPMGLTMLDSKKPKAQPKITAQDIDIWVSTCWAGVRLGSTNKIVPISTFLRYLDDKGIPFTADKYNQIKELAIKKGIIDKDGNILEKNEKNAKKALT